MSDADYGFISDAVPEYCDSESEAMKIWLGFAKNELNNLRKHPDNWLWLKRMNKWIFMAKGLARKWDERSPGDDLDCYNWVDVYHSLLLCEYTKFSCGGSDE